MAEIRMTLQVLRVLKFLKQNITEDVSGADMMKRMKIAAGTIYPILRRLERAGWLESHWEEGTPEELGRPRQKFYRLTGLGQRLADQAIRDVESEGTLSWSF